MFVVAWIESGNHTVFQSVQAAAPRPNPNLSIVAFTHTSDIVPFQAIAFRVSGEWADGQLMETVFRSHPEISFAIFAKGVDRIERHSFVIQFGNEFSFHVTTQTSLGANPKV